MELSDDGDKGATGAWLVVALESRSEHSLVGAGASDVSGEGERFRFSSELDLDMARLFCKGTPCEAQDGGVASIETVFL